MGIVRLKSNIRKDREGDDETEERIFAIDHTPTRKEIMAKRMREKQFGDYSDIESMLKRVGGTMISQTEHIPQLPGDKQTLSRQELSQQQRESRNRAQNRYWTWR